jgi:hypothetical protein
MVGVHAASFMEMPPSLGDKCLKRNKFTSGKTSLVTSIGKESRD